MMPLHTKHLLACAIAIVATRPALAQSPEAGSADASAQSLAAPGDTLTQSFNAEQFNRLFGGLNASPFTGILLAPASVGVAGGSVAGTGLVLTPNGVGPGFVLSSAGTFQPGFGAPGRAPLNSAPQLTNVLSNSPQGNAIVAPGLPAGNFPSFSGVPFAAAEFAPPPGIYFNQTGLPTTGIGTPGFFYQGPGASGEALQLTPASTFNQVYTSRIYGASTAGAPRMAILTNTPRSGLRIVTPNGR